MNIRRRAGRNAPFSTWEYRKLDRGVHMSEVTEIYVDRAFRNLVERIDPPIVTPDDAFRHALFAAAEKVRELRIVLVLEPK